MNRNPKDNKLKKPIKKKNVNMLPSVLSRSPELELEDVVDMLGVSEEVTKDPGYEARLGFSEGFVPPFFFSRKIFWWLRGA